MNISEDGVEILSAYVSTAEVEAIKRELAEIQPDVQRSGIRNAEKKIPAINEIAHSISFIALASHMLGSEARVIPGSHRLGVLSQQKLLETIDTSKPYLCEVEQGDLVLMRPLIIHASAKSLCPLHRRVVHLEYSNYPLPEGLHWA